MSNVINFPVNGKSIRRPQVMLVQDDSFQDNTPGLRSKAAEPIKRIEDIQAISNYLVQEKRYRDNLLFVAGINFGLRCGDLLQLKVGNVITEDGQSYKEEVIIREQKTNKIRRVYLNDAVMDALDLYLSSMAEVSLNDYLFRSNSNRNKNNKPIAVYSVERMLKEVINEKLNIDVQASTHCLRKTFGYHVLMGASDRTRALEFLQKIFGHSSSAITLRYIGITDEEIRETYQGLNLGKMDFIRSSGISQKQQNAV